MSKSNKNPLLKLLLVLIAFTIVNQIALMLVRWHDGKNKPTEEQLTFDPDFHKNLKAQPDTQVASDTTSSETAEAPSTSQAFSPRYRYLPERLTNATVALPSALNVLLRDATSAIVLDATNPKILFGKNHQAPVPVASMSKIMTTLLVLEAIENHKTTLKTRYPVTKEASAINGGEVWLDTRENVDVENLLKATLIRSANDSALLLAQIIAGTEAQFAQLMTRRAKELGMKNARFVNASGLPHGRERQENISSAEDMARLAYIAMQHPKMLEWASTPLDYFETSRRQGADRSQLDNHNWLVRWKIDGVHGLKTGFTNAAGFCNTVTCTRNGRTMVVVLTGMSNSKSRDRLIRRLLDWAYTQP